MNVSAAPSFSTREKQGEEREEAGMHLRSL
jgi:hypothetical protein